MTRAVFVGDRAWRDAPPSLHRGHGRLLARELEGLLADVAVNGGVRVPTSSYTDARIVALYLRKGVAGPLLVFAPAAWFASGEA